MSQFNENNILNCIQSGFPGDQVEVTGDGRHFTAHIISDQFVGMRSLQRHRMVYETLGDHMKADVHALSLKTQTPNEANERNKND